MFLAIYMKMKATLYLSPESNKICVKIKWPNNKANPNMSWVKGKKL